MNWHVVGHYSAIVMATFLDIDSVITILNSGYGTQEPDFLHSNPSFDTYQL